MRACSTGLIVVLTMVLGAPSRLNAQDTRHDQIAAQQADKAAHLQTETSPTGEQVLKRIMSSPLLAGSGGFFPWIGSIYSGTGVAAGGGYLRRATRGSRFFVLGAGTPTGSAMVDGLWSLPSFTSGGVVHPGIDARASRLEDLGYHGVGIGTHEDERTTVSFTPRELNAGFTATFARRLSVDAWSGLLEFGTSIQGVPRQPLVASGKTLTLASRGRARPTIGAHRPATARAAGYCAQWKRYSRRAIIARFVQLEHEVAHLIPLVKEQFVLAFRGLMTPTTADANEEVPVMLAPFLGSGSTLRGFANRRFTDRNRALLTGEYRWRPSRYLDMALFIDAGQVAPRIHDDLDFAEFDVAWGIGASFHGPAYNAFRVEVARGREGIRLVFAGSQPF